MLRLTTWRWVPSFARGLVRDVRVRWALEELGLPYETRLIAHGDADFGGYFSQQPFGQVPVLEDGDLVLFESGAIVLHLAGKGTALMPEDPADRARVMTGVLAALNTVETAIVPLVEIDLFYADQPWAEQRRPDAEAQARKRLAELSSWIGGRDYLLGAFSAADLMMASVLRPLQHSGLVEADPNLCRYRDRCLSRPAFERALADHYADLDGTGPSQGR
jgi:glutathione S-transferase